MKPETVSSTSTDLAPVEPDQALATLPAPGLPSEIGSLAIEMHRRFRSAVEARQQYAGESLADALEKVRAEEPLLSALPKSPDEITYYDLNDLHKRDASAAHEAWIKVKSEARDFVQGGHAASQALDHADHKCWARAVFLSVRKQLIDGIRPRDGLELQLVDQMAQAQVMIWDLQRNLSAYVAIAAVQWGRKIDKNQPFDAPRVEEHDAQEHLMDMIERWQKFYMRALTALQAGRRGKRPVMVRAGGNVNIGGNQVNL